MYNPTNETVRNNTMNDYKWFTSCLQNHDLIKQLKTTKLVISDVDGCLTDCAVCIAETGTEHKCFSVQDGFGITQAQKAGLIIAFASGRKDKSTQIRAEKLGIPENLCIVGIDSDTGKGAAINQIQKTSNVTKKETILFGDDILDIEVKEQVGLFVCPYNALFYVQRAADIVLPKHGGNGAFRLLLDLILYAQNKHRAQHLIQQVI